jgi:hypothetical protein
MGAPVAYFPKSLGDALHKPKVVYWRRKFDVAKVAGTGECVVFTGGATETPVQRTHQQAQDTVVVGEFGFWLGKTGGSNFNDRKGADMVRVGNGKRYIPRLAHCV